MSQRANQYHAAGRPSDNETMREWLDERAEKQDSRKRGTEAA